MTLRASNVWRLSFGTTGLAQGSSRCEMASEGMAMFLKNAFKNSQHWNLWRCGAKIRKHCWRYKCSWLSIVVSFRGRGPCFSYTRLFCPRSYCFAFRVPPGHDELTPNVMITIHSSYFLPPFRAPIAVEGHMRIQEILQARNNEHQQNATCTTARTSHPVSPATSGAEEGPRW